MEIRFNRLKGYRDKSSHRQKSRGRRVAGCNSAALASDERQRFRGRVSVGDYMSAVAQRYSFGLSVKRTQFRMLCCGVKHWARFTQLYE